MLQAGPERAPLPPLRTEPPAATRELPEVPDRGDGGDGSGGAGRTDRAGRAARVEKRPAGEQDAPHRDPYLDNAKYLTIVLVAVGHAWAPLTVGSRPTAALYYLLYTFHMPAFVIISGYLSRGFEYRPRQIRRLLTGVVVPYLVFQTLFTFFMRWAGDEPEREFAYQEPEFALWFLVALCLWRLTTPLWKALRWPLPVSLAVAVAAGVTPSVSGDLELMRVAQFLPFFVLGLRLRPRHLEFVRHRAVRILAVPVTAGAVAVSYAAVPYISAAPFLHDKDAQSLGLPSWLGAVMTLTAFGCALVMTVCFLSWVPRRRMWFTSLGAGTLCAYVLHVYPLQYAKELGWFEDEGAQHPLDRFAITVIAAGLMTLLCTAPVRRALRFVLEPRLTWFFTPQANAPAPRAPAPHAPAASAPRLPVAPSSRRLELPAAPVSEKSPP
ncbi:acyltransferase family protein [Streptomyces sp. WMMB 322]|uniref:acyltransferase family protein n=1 Tax=Streptomyces sp. WMMB 322 TaxID=1286821 RepID=UPI00082391C2|nr:acyltransferase family protein [Streptomyces sp. WMMB 322]SCK34894.1 Fucose 4-O-acetylase [Streptomyces sp. WMMB 322]